MYVCLCRGVSERVVRACVRDGASSVREVGRACGAGTGCGACHGHIRDVIEEERDRAAAHVSLPLVGSAALATAMKSTPQILDVLNDVLTAELTAINQYFLHAKMLENWGYAALAKHVRHESIDEMKHAEELCERILYLEGVPNLQRLGKLKIGESPKEQFENDLAMEYDAVKRFNAGAKICAEAGDLGTEEVLRRMLVSEESHVDWLETQLGLIARLGEQAYLAQHLHVGS